MVLPGPIPYTLNIPDGPHNPSNDQPDMQENTNSIDTLLNVDHYTFDNAFAGWHQQIHLPTLGAVPSADASMGTVYTRTGSQLCYTPDASGNEYQLTRAITASYATFGQNTNYATNANGTFNGGWSFIAGGAAGGLLLQYGSITNPIQNSTGTATFPINFTGTPFSITVSIGRTPFSSSSQFFYVGALSNSGFTFSNTTNTNTIYWMAIGI